MRSTNHRKYPARSYRNDYDFASFGDSSASVFSRNAARFDGEFSATDQIAPAETILSGRAIATARTGCLHSNQGSGIASCSVAKGGLNDTANEPAFFYRATLFDSVMEFLDRYDQAFAIPKSSKGAAQTETSTT